MTVQVSHINKANIKTSHNQVLFTNKNLDINNLKPICARCNLSMSDTVLRCNRTLY